MYSVFLTANPPKKLVLFALCRHSLGGGIRTGKAISDLFGLGVRTTPLHPGTQSYLLLSLVVHREDPTRAKHSRLVSRFIRSE